MHLSTLMMLHPSIFETKNVINVAEGCHVHMFMIFLHAPVSWHWAFMRTWLEIEACQTDS